MSFFKKIFSKKKKKQVQPKILLEEKSPVCPITAVVEQDDRVAYFYLWGDENTNFGTKACWIRNLIPASEVLKLKPVLPPVLLKSFCLFPEGQKPLDANDLSVEWTEESDAAVLYEKEEIIAIIPSWSGIDGFTGYARDCIGKTSFAWELKRENDFFKRIKKAEKYWDSWYEELSPFYVKQPIILEKYEDVLGKHDKYYAIDGGEIPLKGMYLRRGENKTIFATIGVSLVPQPQVEKFYTNRNDYNRIELGLMLNSPHSEENIDKIASSIGSISNAPWDNITWIGEGHTINFDFPETETFKAVVFTSNIDCLPKIELEEYRDSKINFLWMIPISERERDFIMENGNEEIFKRLNKIGKEIFNLNRSEVL